MPVDDDDGDETSSFGQPLPPDDRLWRHPSELTWLDPAPPAPGAAPASVRPVRVWALSLVSGLVGAVLTLGVVLAIDRPRVERTVVERVPVRPVVKSPADDEGVVAIAKSVSPSVVRIEAEFGSNPALGSGVIFRNDGHVLTNAHVVAGADRITVVLSSGRELAGELLGTDMETDTAVVRIDGRGLPTAILGSTEELEVGQTAIAIGSPLGLEGGPSVTVGVISALGRRLHSVEGVTLHNMIQTDAPIAEGSSGGALVDGSGVVVGITSAMASNEGAGLGFAVPIEVARSVADDIIANGRVRHVWLGIEGGDDDRGARINHVVPGSPAAVAGLADGDVIVAVNGEKVTSMSSLVVRLREHDPGETIHIDYLRDGQPDSCDATLAEQAS